MEDYRSLKVGDFTVRYRDFTHGEVKQAEADGTLDEFITAAIQSIEPPGSTPAFPEQVSLDSLPQLDAVNILQAVYYGKPLTPTGGSTRRR